MRLKAVVDFPKKTLVGADVIHTATLVAMSIKLLLLVRISNRDLRDLLFTLWVKRIIPPHFPLYLVLQREYLIPIEILWW